MDEEEEGWSEMPLGGANSHPELGRAYGSQAALGRGGGGAPPWEGGEQRACRWWARGEGHTEGSFSGSCDHFWSPRTGQSRAQPGNDAGPMRQSHEQTKPPAGPSPEGRCLPVPGSSVTAAQQDAVLACLVNLTIYSY